MYPIPRSRAAPELVAAYSVSEFESPVPRVQPEEAFEDNLDIQELFVAPSLPRRSDYHRPDESDYENQRTIALAPPTLDIYLEDYEWVGHRPPVPLHDVHDYDRRRENSWHRRLAVSPQSSSGSSGSSALHCEECAYTKSKRRYDNHYRGARMNLVPYNITPGGNVGRRASPSPSPSPAHANAAHYIHEAPRFYGLHDFQGPSPPREGFWDDRTSSNANVHNQIVLYRDAAQSSSSEGRIAFDEMHSNESSSPGWSTRGQRHLAGSETQSDIRSESQFSSFDGLYEDTYPRFARQARPPRRVRPSLSHQRAVIVTRSDEGGDYEEYSDSSRSYSSSERSLSSGGYYRRDYARRY